MRETGPCGRGFGPGPSTQGTPDPRESLEKRLGPGAESRGVPRGGQPPASRSAAAHRPSTRPKCSHGVCSLWANKGSRPQPLTAPHPQVQRKPLCVAKEHTGPLAQHTWLLCGSAMGVGPSPLPRALGPCVPTSSPAGHWSSLSQQEPRSTGSVPSNPSSCCARPAWLGHWGECPGEGRGPRRRRLLGPGGFQQRHLESVTDHTLPGQAAVPEGLGSLATLQAAGQGERVPLRPRSPCGRAPAVGGQDG